MITKDLEVGKTYYLSGYPNDSDVEVSCIGIKFVLYIADDGEHVLTIEQFKSSYTEKVEKEIVKLYGYINNSGIYVETINKPRGDNTKTSYREIELEGEIK